MVDSTLIRHYLGDLRRRLPTEVVDELTDGLLEEYEQLCGSGWDPRRAARQALADFGDVDCVVREFTRQAPGRRAARTQLLVGPIVGLCWSVTLVLARAWTWAVPSAAWLTMGAALLLAIMALLAAATARTSLRHTQLAAVGILDLALLDAVGISLMAGVASALGGMVIVALIASLGRMSLTVRSLPQFLRH